MRTLSTHLADLRRGYNQRWVMKQSEDCILILGCSGRVRPTKAAHPPFMEVTLRVTEIRPSLLRRRRTYRQFVPHHFDAIGLLRDPLCDCRRIGRGDRSLERDRARYRLDV